MIAKIFNGIDRLYKNLRCFKYYKKNF